jgi:hypothetical protein
MKRACLRLHLLRKKFILGFFSIILCFPVKAQLGDVAKVLTAGTADANILAKAYLTPFGKGFAYSLSNGWYNTASTHGTLGFDITLLTNIASLPSSLKTYDLSTLNLSSLKYNNPVGPTIAGKDVTGPEMTFTQTVTLPDKSTQDVSVKFNMPKGVNLPIVPTFVIQAGIGLPKGTEIIGRYMPTLKIGDYGKMGLWGIGIKHDLKQWIPVVNKVPFWSMSVLFSYTGFNSSVKGEFLTPDPNYFYTTGLNMDIYNNQKVELKSSAFDASLLLSTNIPVINVYAGLGLVSASSSLKLNGTFPVPDTPKALDVQNSVDNNEDVKLGVKNILDPLDVKMVSKTNFKATVGLRLKLGLLTLHGDYSYLDKMNLFSAGIGLSFR